MNILGKCCNSKGNVLNWIQYLHYRVPLMNIALVTKCIHTAWNQYMYLPCSSVWFCREEGDHDGRWSSDHNRRDTAICCIPHLVKSKLNSHYSLGLCES